MILPSTFNEDVTRARQMCMELVARSPAAAIGACGELMISILEVIEEPFETDVVSEAERALLSFAMVIALDGVQRDPDEARERNEALRVAITNLQGLLSVVDHLTNKAGVGPAEQGREGCDHDGESHALD